MESSLRCEVHPALPDSLAAHVAVPEALPDCRKEEEASGVSLGLRSAIHSIASHLEDKGCVEREED